MAKNKYKVLEGLSVRVDDIIYMPSLDAPADKPHPFVYFITIVNGSTEHVSIIGRKWVVSEQDGETTVVEGEGIVGQMQALEPGEEFSYNSYHIAGSNAVVRGSFFGTTADDRKVLATIPEFKLELPDWA